MTQTVKYENVITDQITPFNTHILDALRGLALKEGKNRLRLWLDGVINKDTRQAIKDCPPQPGDQFLDWAERCFGDQRFGIILNSSQNYSDQLSKVFATIFSPLLAQFGLPYGGLDITFFIGNYGYTPIGFHQDPIGDKVMHFHLGPGNKEMYTIDPKKYEQEIADLTNMKNGETNYEALIPHATKHIIRPGDVFFMAPGQYHVGKSEEISAAITVWHREPSVNEMQQQVSTRLIDRIFSGESTELVKTQPTANNRNPLPQALAPTVFLDHEYKDLTLKDCYLNLTKDIELELKSNAYLNGKVVPHTDEIAITADTILKGNAPFNIQYKAISEELAALFMRGHRVVFPMNEGLESMINTLNTYQEIKVIDLIEPLLEEWEEEVGIELCEVLWQYKAIELVSE